MRSAYLMEMGLYGKNSTLADIARIAQAKPRSVQLWADAGVILPVEGTDREGSGRHRLFEPREVLIASVIARFAAEQMAIGMLKSFAFFFRSIMSNGAEMKLLKQAINGDVELYIAFGSIVSGSGLDIDVRIFDGREEFFTHVLNSSNSGQLVSTLCLTTILSPMRELFD